MEMLASLADKLPTANESHFAIEIAGLSGSLFKVLSFESNNDSLCNDYQFNIEVLSEELIEPDLVIGKDVTLTITWAMSDRTISGIITEYLCHGRNHQGYVYTLSLQSLLVLLKHQRSNRVFTDMSADAIVKSVLDKAGFPAAKLQVKASSPTLEMTVQYDESDFDFVTRLMRRYGFVYGSIESTDGQANLSVFNTSSDFSSQMEEITLPYVAPTGQVRSSESVFAFSKKSSFLNAGFHLYDEDYESGSAFSLNSQNQSTVAGFGESSIYAENFTTQGDGDTLTQVHQQSIDCQRNLFIVDTDCRALRPGLTLTITDHPSYSGRYLIVSVAHKGCQSGSVEYGSKVKGLTYKNQATIIPIDVQFKAPVIKRKKVFASFNATIEQEVDDKGRYKVKLPFNQDGEGEQSKPTRLMQHYGGPGGHGMHFPLNKGTEVIVAGENGDLDRPVILGALFNDEALSPVTAENSTENKLVTKAEHTLLMDDKQGEEKIQLFTKGQENILEFNATEGSEFIKLETQKGYIDIKSKEAMTMSSQANMAAEAEKEISIRAEDAIYIQSIEANVEINAKEAVQLSADIDINIQSSQSNILFESQQNISLEAAQDISYFSVQGNVELAAQNGDFTVNAERNISIVGQGSGSIQLSQGGGKIEIDAAGNITIEANNLNLSASNIAVSGSAISHN
ncbi:type VI secretion system Vgr family protein [Pseudoalteromonas piscicida]|uniref:type VI secretion system Vgr family protein n=1 Tax=Pseudoalteromonas piscicida TaxID=43662 RepID=UPI0030B07ECC